MIRLENVSKTFTDSNKEVHAVNNVSLTINDGDIFGIIGFSGAGKSTLVRCINLLEKPTDGKVFVDDAEITALSGKELRKARKKIGMIFQHFNLMPSRTIFGNVAYPLRGSGLSKEEIKAIIPHRDPMLLVDTVEEMEAGDHIVASSTIYGGTFNLISVTMKKMGIEATFVDPLCTEEELNAAFQPNTKVVFGETIANPALTVLDIEKFAKAAHAHGVPLMVDNTFPTPVNCRPFEWGADIVTHSTTKYMDGHGAVLGGAIVDGGKFDWMAHAEKFPGLCTPDESYHGITYAERFGKEGAFITKATAQLMRDLGSIPSPHNAFLLGIGLETLFLRVQRHCENAQKVAEFLEENEKVAWVNYPGLPSNKGFALAQKYMPHGTSGVVSFGVKGGREAATRFMDHLELAAIVTHVADARTCVLHPASTTHRQLTDEQLDAAGVGPDLIRLSVGIEYVDDIIADLRQALEQA